MSEQAALFICGPSRGRYGPPIPFRSAWTKSSIGRLKGVRCDTCHRRYKLGYMYVSKWTLTREEMEEAVKEFDYMSLDLPPEYICRRCKKKAEAKKEAGDAV